MTEFLHDVVRKQNLDTYMRGNDNDWDGYFHPEQDPWSDIGLTQLTVDWMAANVRQVTDSGELGGGPF